jgi:hypothetical protein
MAKHKHYYGQQNPHDQLAAVIGSFDGTISNLEDGIVATKQVIPQLKAMVDCLRGFLPHLEGLEWKRTEGIGFELLRWETDQDIEPTRR